MPAFDRSVADPPLVRPGEDAGSGDAALDCRLQLPVENLGLTFLPVHRTVLGGEAHLAQNERAITGQVMQPRQIATEVGAALEEDVEHEEVERLEGQILRRRVIGVGEQPVGVLGARGVDQVAQRVGDHVHPVPAQDVRRHLVAEDQAEDPIVAVQAPCGLSHLGPGGGSQLAVLTSGPPEQIAPVGVEDAGKHADPVLCGRVEQVITGDRVGPYDGEAGVGDRGEVTPQLRPLGKGETIFARLESSVGDPAKVEPLAAHGEELAVGSHLSLRRRPATGFGRREGNTPHRPINAPGVGRLARSGRGIRPGILTFSPRHPGHQ